MDMKIIVLWALANTLNFVFPAISTGRTLTRKYSLWKTILVWGVTGILYFLIALTCYSINLYNDVIVAFSFAVLLSAVAIVMYRQSLSGKVFMAMSAVLVTALCVFMFCGTTDALVGGKLNLFDPVYGPYTVRNILFFIIVKIVVLSSAVIAYLVFLKKKVHMMIANAKTQMRYIVIAPVASFLGFMILNKATNAVGIVPGNPQFLPIYGTICVIFIVEYIQIFSAVHWMAEAARTGKLVRMDGLTGLNNRLAFEEAEKQLNRKLDQSPVDFGIVMIDLNYLKIINDSYGHDKGDIALKLLSDHIRMAFTNCDCYRIGGDEFAVILKDKQLALTEKYIDEFRKELDSNPNTEIWRHISAAVGYSTFDHVADHEFDDVFKRADQEMYSNKVIMKAERRI